MQTLKTLVNTPKAFTRPLQKALAGLFFSAACCSSSYSLAADDPNFFYFNQGDTPADWMWVLGDEANWWQPLEGNEGRSGTGKLKITVADYQGKGDAVHLSWNKKNTWAVANIAGRTIDLAKYEQQAELIIVAKLDRKAVGEVKLAMDCGENCRGELPIKDMLNQPKIKTWFVLPIPLDCFTKAGVAKLNNVMTPFSIGTNGKLSLSIASINIQKMAAGDEGCVPNNNIPNNNAPAPAAPQK